MTVERSQSRLLTRGLIAFAGVGAALWMLLRLERIVLVLIVAMLVAYVLAQIVTLAQHPVRWRGRLRCLSRGAAVVVVYLLLGSAAAVSGAILWPRAAQQLDEAIAAVPAYTDSFHAWERGWTRYYGRLRMPAELRKSIDQSVVGAGDAAVGYAHGSFEAVIGLLSDIPWMLLVPVFAFFLLKDAAVIRRTIVTALPHRIQLRGHRLFGELNATLTAYVRAQLIACVLVGAACGIGFALLGSPYPILLGVLAAALEFVPLVGPLLLAAVAVAIAALHDPMLAAWTALFLAVLRAVEDYVVYPRLIGRTIHLHPLVIMLAVLAGVELGGVAGIFIAVPVVALATVVVRHWLEWRDRDQEVAEDVLVRSEHRHTHEQLLTRTPEIRREQIDVQSLEA